MVTEHPFRPGVRYFVCPNDREYEPSNYAGVQRLAARKRRESLMCLIRRHPAGLTKMRLAKLSGWSPRRVALGLSELLEAGLIWRDRCYGRVLEDGRDRRAHYVYGPMPEEESCRTTSPT